MVEHVLVKKPLGRSQEIYPAPIVAIALLLLLLNAKLRAKLARKQQISVE